MTWSLTLAGPPRAGAISKTHDYQKSTKNEGSSENMSFNGERKHEFFSSEEKILTCFFSHYGV